MPTPAEVIDALAPMARAVGELNLTDPSAATTALERAFPAAERARVGALLRAANAEGWLTPKRATATLSFGRVAKPAPELGGCSIDAVDMAGAGAGHTHPNGEVSLCFTTDGDARFVGHRDGWVVVPPGSHHVPEVTGGRMLIVYFLPGGAMVWDS